MAVSVPCSLWRRWAKRRLGQHPKYSLPLTFNILRLSQRGMVIRRLRPIWTFIKRHCRKKEKTVGSVPPLVWTGLVCSTKTSSNQERAVILMKKPKKGKERHSRYVVPCCWKRLCPCRPAVLVVVIVVVVVSSDFVAERQKVPRRWTQDDAVRQRQRQHQNDQKHSRAHRGNSSSAAYHTAF